MNKTELTLVAWEAVLPALFPLFLFLASSLFADGKGRGGGGNMEWVGGSGVGGAVVSGEEGGADARGAIGVRGRGRAEADGA